MENGNAVYVANSTTAKRKNVEIGIIKGEEVQIKLAQNPKIAETVFETLLASDKPDVLSALISNEQMQSAQLKALFDKDSKQFGKELAANVKTEVAILSELANSDDVEVLLALAKNPSTPVELLYQFQLDRRLERAVKENSSFGKHIQRDNIGWNV